MQVFIVSWAGKHSNAVQMAKQISAIHHNVTIVYSDPFPGAQLDTPSRTIRRPNELFWGDKFKTCLDACGDEPMLVLHADCTHQDWGALFQHCKQTVTKIPNIGVWSPTIDYVPWNLEIETLQTIPNTSLSLAVRTDAICFYLAAPIVQRMKQVDYQRNVYGRGIEALFVANAFTRGLMVVIDQAVCVHHPNSSGYPVDIANQQCTEFMKQFNIMESIHVYFFMLHIFHRGADVPQPILEITKRAH